MKRCPQVKTVLAAALWPPGQGHVWQLPRTRAAYDRMLTQVATELVPGRKVILAIREAQYALAAIGITRP